MHFYTSFVGLALACGRKIFTVSRWRGFRRLRDVQAWHAAGLLRRFSSWLNSRSLDIDQHCTTGFSQDRNLRSPHALQRVFDPSGPRRHCPVSALLQLWHRPGGIKRPRRLASLIATSVGFATPSSSFMTSRMLDPKGIASQALLSMLKILFALTRFLPLARRGIGRRKGSECRDELANPHLPSLRLSPVDRKGCWKHCQPATAA
jgi:hypothetical protein